jgi:glycerol-3-phosphate dehydrogenase (NAD(P)+)
MTKICILGAGSWAIALSVLLHSNHHQMSMWEFNREDMERLSSERENPRKLPGVKVPDAVEITDDLDYAARDKEVLLLALPSHTVREVAGKLSRKNLSDPTIVNLAKGIENNTLCRMSEVLVEELPKSCHRRIVTLSGPSHAEEVARRIPTSVVVAGFEENIAKKVQLLFMNQYFRVYTNSDLPGVELGGSLKNVIAIASGICDGLKLGDNTKGALLTRGLAEMMRLGERMGAKIETFAGLSGMGDLITTCMSPYSRNRWVGEEIGKGKSLKQILEKMVVVAEGVRTTGSAYQLAGKHKVEMPITEQVYRVLFEDKNPKQALLDLMSRDPKSEIWS